MPALLHHGGQAPLAELLSISATSASPLAAPSCSASSAPPAFETSRTAPVFPARPISSAYSHPEPISDPSLLHPFHDTSTGLQTHTVVISESRPEPQIEHTADIPEGAQAHSGLVPGVHNASDVQMLKSRVSLSIITSILSLFTFRELYHRFGPPTVTTESREDVRWIESSHSWWDRKACKWMGVCGLTHLNKKKWGWSDKQRLRFQQPILGYHDDVDNRSFWAGGKEDPDEWAEDERVLRHIPNYILDHAPLMHLYSDEQFWPCDIAEHLIHTTPHLNYTPLLPTSEHPDLQNLDDLNKWGRFVYLQSDDNVEERPDWLGGEENIPNRPGAKKEDDPDWYPGRRRKFQWSPLGDDQSLWEEAGQGDTRDKGGSRPAPSSPTAPVPTDTSEGEELLEESRKRSTDWLLGRKTVGGRSDAPVVLIAIDKGDGVVDAFWFFFYSYNLGNSVLNVRFGNHVGDWEHTVVRFRHGEPKAVFFSEHAAGEAYSYDAVEKVGKRPVGYVAAGTHAMYATAGTHPYVLPWGLLHDVTDRGPLWDPLLNVHSYTYDYLNDTLRSSTLTPRAPTGWFYYQGHWGDKFYPLSDPRQYRFVGQYHYVNGPLGPRFKNLGRKHICQGNAECVIKHWVGARKAKRWEGQGEGEEMSEADVQQLLRAGRLAE